MGKHLTHSRTPQDLIPPNANRYSMGKRLAIREDLEAGFSIGQVCTRHGIARATAHAIRHDEELAEIITPQIVEARRKRMASIYEYQADLAMDGLNRESWKNERPTSRITAAAIATDKARLLRGESTENVSLRGMVENYTNQAAELDRKKRLILDAISDVK